MSTQFYKHEFTSSSLQLYVPKIEDAENLMQHFEGKIDTVVFTLTVHPYCRVLSVQETPNPLALLGVHIQGPPAFLVQVPEDITGEDVRRADYLIYGIRLGAPFNKPNSSPLGFFGAMGLIMALYCTTEAAVPLSDRKKQDSESFHISLVPYKPKSLTA